jgi:hypothetical protein
MNCSKVYAYSITSSARAISVGEMVRPIVEAVFRLMISSNSVASCTGRGNKIGCARIIHTLASGRLASQAQLVRSSLFAPDLCW